MRGAYRAWLSTWSSAAHRSRRAARSNRLSWLFSAANDLTTRVPVTFSSTIVAMSAVRAIITHAMGKSFLRMFMPVNSTKGNVTQVTSVSTGSISNMSASAARKLRPATAIIGANMSTIWMARMSELAREMSWPDCTLS